MSRNLNSEGTLNSYVVSPIEVQAGDRYGYKIIAIVYDMDFWAAYRGLTDWSDSRVAAEGDVISREIAEYLFPSVANTIPNYNY